MFDRDPGRARAAFDYLACRQSVGRDPRLSLRDCLAGRHDALLAGLNRRYWEAVAAPGM